MWGIEVGDMLGHLHSDIFFWTCGLLDGFLVFEVTTFRADPFRHDFYQPFSIARAATYQGVEKGFRLTSMQLSLLISTSFRLILALLGNKISLPQSMFEDDFPNFPRWDMC